MSGRACRGSRSSCFVVGLALHNLAMAELWDAGVRGASLDVVAAWKDVLLAGALAVALLGARSLPLRSGPTGSRSSTRRSSSSTGCCRRAGSTARRRERGQLFAARHDLIPVAAYFLGRLLVLDARRLAPALARARRRVAVGAHASGASPTSTSCRCSGGATRACRAGSRSSSGSSTAGLSRPAGELGPEHGRRGEPDPPARLDVPQPARDRVRARDRPALPRRPPADAVDGRRGRRRLRRPALDAHPSRVPRARARARRARPRRSAACSRSVLAVASLVVGVGVRQGVPAHRAVDELHAGGARDPARAGPGRTPA